MISAFFRHRALLAFPVYHVSSSLEIMSSSSSGFNFSLALGRFTELVEMDCVAVRVCKYVVGPSGSNSAAFEGPFTCRLVLKIAYQHVLC